MALKRLVKLGRKNAIDLIKDEEYVWYKRGCCRGYRMTFTDSAIREIKQSGYGVDVYIDSYNMKFYIVQPVDFDMR